MKIRTTKYIIKEALINICRNKLMSIASISIIVASLIVFGIFLLISMNLNHNVPALKDQPEIQIFCEADLEDPHINNIEETIKKNPRVKPYEIVSKKEAYEIAKNMLGESKEALEGFDENIMPVSFKINLINPDEVTLAGQEFKNIKGVEKVKFSLEEIKFVTKIVYVIQLISVVFVIILMLFSVLIISNTIKIAVYSRRKEIEIMKYVGATDWFIRWPFIVEGIMTGIIGSIVGYFVVFYIYKISVIKLSEIVDILKFLSTSEVSFELIASYLMLGVIAGAFGSAISIRKYLKV